MITEEEITEIVDRHCSAFFGNDYVDSNPNCAYDFKVFGKSLKKELIDTLNNIINEDNYNE